MITVSKNIQLQQITAKDCARLKSLMQEVYPPAYHHFWKDKGNWYVENQYSKENIKKELLEENSDYYFIVYKKEITGNVRILWDKNLKGFKDKKTVKLHRVYLHPKTQGNGIGKSLLSWLENNAKEKEYEMIWLDVMDEQPQAFQFYKKYGYIYHSHWFLDFNLLKDEVRKISQLYKNI